MFRYRDATKRWRQSTAATRAAIHAAMRVDESFPDREDAVRVARAGDAVRLEQTCELRLERGGSRIIESRVPHDVPPGVHELRSPGGGPASWLIVTPGRCPPPPANPEWGWALQLYALRSRQSWGIGDFGDLREFSRWARQRLGTDFTLLNPLGAPLPVKPQENSPYYPSSRLFLNPLYLRIEEIPGAERSGVPLQKLAAVGQMLNARRRIDRDAVFRLKIRALERIWSRFKGDPGFDRFCARQGEPLRQFAIFCAVAEHHGEGWSKWPARFHRPGAESVEHFADEHADRVRFHQWLQWLLDDQLARAASELPLMLDVPVGVNPDGFDAWLWQDLLALDASVGAPPDEYNTQGQDWGLPPFIPHRLRASGYEPLRRTIRAMLRHASGLRIDHVMGLFRLYWIPRGLDARRGAYVRYRADELLAVLAIESQRAKAVVVGEDLGTVETGVRSKLRHQNVLSYRLLWFEKTPPERYPAPALAAVTTHDIFTVAGLWTGSDLAAQRRLGLHPNAKGTQSIRRALARKAGLDDSASPRDAILGAHRLLSRSPCRLRTATLDDALAVEERPNMPATTTQWPNWRLALPKTLEAIKRDALVRQVARTMKGETTP
jgi:4-alpha-glucanotransferase